MAEVFRTSSRRLEAIDQSLIVEGKRVRKAVDRFGSTTPSSSSRRNPGNDFNGLGVPLGNIEKVNQEIERSTHTELRSLHKILFGTVGRAATSKAEIKQFNGFAFNKYSLSYEKKISELGKISYEDLQLMKKVLGLNVDGVYCILDFLMAPKKPTLVKRRSNERMRDEASPKRPRTSDTPAGLLLSESSDEEMEEEEEQKKEMKPVVKQKKRVSFEDEHRLVREIPGLAAVSMEDGVVSEDVKETVTELIGAVDDVNTITIGWLVDEVIRKYPEHAANRESVKEHAIKELRGARN